MKKNTIDLLKEVMSPQMAIIVYKTHDSVYYLERRDIKKSGTMGAGAPLTKQCLANLVIALSESDPNAESNTTYGMLPHGMLYADSRPENGTYIWHHKEEKRHLLFDSRLNIPNGEMYVPGLIYKVHGSTLSVYAYKGTLSERSKLYRAPFFNVSSHSVCLGNAKIALPQQQTFAQIIRYWEDLFWKSEFIHELGGNPVVGNLHEITTTCIESGCKFPSDQLLPIPDYKLKNLFK